MEDSSFACALCIGSIINVVVPFDLDFLLKQIFFLPFPLSSVDETSRIDG